MTRGLQSETVKSSGSFARGEQREPLCLGVEEVRELEAAIARAGTSLATLMERAGRSVAGAVLARTTGPCSVLVLAGSGNNGGDGWVCAVELAREGYPVTLVSPKAPEDLIAQPARDEAIAALAAIEMEALPLVVKVNPSVVEVEESLDGACVVVDGLLGTGFSGEALREPFASWVEAANRRRSAGAGANAGAGAGANAGADAGAGAGAGSGDESAPAAGAPLAVAIDVPSGLHADSGFAAAPCFVADVTVSMLACKAGLLDEAGKRYVGECVVETLGVDPSFFER